METNHTADRYGGSDLNTHYLNMAWSWVAMIRVYEKALEELHVLTIFPDDTTDWTVVSYTKAQILAFIDIAMTKAQNCLDNTVDGHVYKAYLESKPAQQLKRGMLTHSEYWQQFIVFKATYEPF